MLTRLLFALELLVV